VRSKPNTKKIRSHYMGLGILFSSMSVIETSFSLSLKFPLIIVGTAIIIYKRVIHYGSNVLTQI
jgi:hypothetical protein